MRLWRIAAVAATALVAACASTPKPVVSPATVSTAPPVHRAQERRIIGSENGLRVEAFVNGDSFKDSSVSVQYDIINDRATPVAVAELIPVSTYDADQRTITLEIGSEVPGVELLPRLLVIPPGAKMSFTAAARTNVVRPGEGVTLPPSSFRLKVNFLGDTKPFEQLIGIPERAVHDPDLANKLFPQWLERNEIVITNTLPMRWAPSHDGQPGADWATPHPIYGRRH